MDLLFVDSFKDSSVIHWAPQCYSHCMSTQCNNKRLLECGVLNIAEEKRPENVEELEDFCTRIITLGHCMQRVLEECAKSEEFPYDDERDVESVKNIVEFVESSCDKDSEIFTAIADNLHCVTSTFDTMDDICLSSGINDTLRMILSSLLDEYDITGCASDAWVFYCINARFDVECGCDVRNAIAEITKNTADVVAPYCKEKIDRVPFLEAAFKSEFRRGNIGKCAVSAVLEAISKKMD